MTYEEALDVLTNKIQIDVKFTEDFNRDYDCLMKCKEALEKQIPKKPNIIHAKHQRHYNDKYLCPVCGESVDTDCGDPFMDYGLDWCNHCGQAINWN